MGSDYGRNRYRRHLSRSAQPRTGPPDLVHAAGGASGRSPVLLPGLMFFSDLARDLAAHHSAGRSHLRPALQGSHHRLEGGAPLGVTEKNFSYPLATHAIRNSRFRQVRHPGHMVGGVRSYRDDP